MTAHDHRSVGGIEGYDPSSTLRPVKHYPGAAAPFALVMQSSRPQPLVEDVVSTVEVFYDVVGAEENRPLIAHRSKIDGFASRRANSGLGFGGWSSSD